MTNNSNNEEAKMTNNSREIAADELKQVTGGMGFPPLPFQVAALSAIQNEPVDPCTRPVHRARCDVMY